MLSVVSFGLDIGLKDEKIRLLVIKVALLACTFYLFQLIRIKFATKITTVPSGLNPPMMVTVVTT